MLKTAAFALACLSALLAACPAMAEDNYVITLKDHQFTPQNITLPAHQKLKLIVKNEQTGTAEFESAELEREKVVAGGSQVIVIIEPLDPGTYKYFDDFHRESTGTITVK